VPVRGRSDVGGGEVTLAADQRKPASAPPPRKPDAIRRPDDDQPVEFWSTAAIHAALQGGDIATWKRIAAALKRDPYGRTSRQVEEILKGSRPVGIAKALWEVLERARTHLEANERAEVARHVKLLMDRCGLAQQEFASRIGVPAEDLNAYLDGSVSPSASLMIRMRRLSDRFVRVKNERSPNSN